jgi:cobalt-zinc-cadmium efflux system membrane fusion protein
MRTSAVLTLLLIGVAAGAFFHRPLWRLLPQHASESAELAGERKETSKPAPKRDKRLIVVDADIAKLLGVEIATAESGVLRTEIAVAGTIGFNEDRLARIVPRVAGTVRQVLKSVGDRVALGEPLAILDSKEVADAKAIYLASKDKLSFAETTFGREDELFKKRVSSEQDLINSRRDLTQARSEMRIATQSLLTMGLRDPDLRRLEAAPDDFGRFDIVAPFAGEVIEKRLFTGEFLPQDREVFIVADLDVVWVRLQVSLDRLKDVAVGNAVRIVGNDGVSAEAKIGYLAPVISNETRAAPARVDFPNPEHRWRPGAVVQALIEGPAEPAAAIIPTEAIQTVEGLPSVFLPVDEGFRLQAVKLGRSNGKVTEILKGVKAGDKVAAGQTFALKSELEKGAGEDND